MVICCFRPKNRPNGLERIQGAWTSDDDIYKITDFLREQRAPEYNDEVIAQQVAMKGGGLDDMGDLGRKYDPNDPLVRKAVELCINNGRFATSMLQGRMSKGHGWVDGLSYYLEDIGAIGPKNGNRPRDMLISSMDEFDQLANA